MDLSRTKKYTTIHSIRDDEKRQIIEKIEKDDLIFLDYGCHMGHLSLEIALRFPIKILAVDNFVGTKNDKLMEKTVKDVTGGTGNFKNLVMSNIEEVSKNYVLLGKIDVLTPDELFATYGEDSIDFAFIDSSHSIDEYQEYEKIAKMVKSGKILGGHDYSSKHPGVIKGIESIQHDFDWISKNYTFFMRKKSKTS